MLVLSVLSLIGLGLTTSDSLSPDEKHVLGIADDFICALFFLDFIVSMVKAPDRKAYFGDDTPGAFLGYSADPAIAARAASTWVLAAAACACK